LRKGIRELHDWRTEVILFFGVFAGTTWVQQPSRFSFFGDSWDVLYFYLIDPRSIFQPHNEHFIPLFNILYFAQYKLFGAHHLDYMLVLYLLHSLAAVFVYRIGRQIQLPYWSSITAALLFSFSSVPWEVLGWSFEQQFGLGVVFLLASLDTFPEEEYLMDEEKLEQFNLVRNGGFEQPLGPIEWRRFAGAEFSRDAGAGHHGEYGININLPAPGSAFSRDVVDDCSPNVAGKVFTFAVEAKTRVPAALIARMLFKARDGRILAAFSSEPHSGDAQWHQLITGGLSPPETCTISVDLSDDGTDFEC